MPRTKAQKRRRHEERANRVLYFAYGSNLDLSGMKGRAPDAEKIGPAILDHWRLTFRGVADIERAAGESVRGGLWLLSQKDAKSIDRYEGAPFLYARQKVKVRNAEGKLVKAMTYVMVDQSDIGLPSTGYYESIARGFKAFGLPLEALRHALRRVQQEHEAKGIRKYRRQGPKRMMAVLPAPKKRGAVDFGSEYEEHPLDQAARLRDVAEQLMNMPLRDSQIADQVEDALFLVESAAMALEEEAADAEVDDELERLAWDSMTPATRAYYSLDHKWERTA